MSQGWVKIFRKIQNNPLWQDKPFSRGQAWIDLILLANHEPGFIFVRGNKVKVERSQVGYSIVKLSERWGWSRGKVTRFLDEQEMVQQIAQQKNNITSLITIVNYDTYQSNGQQNEHKTDANKKKEERIFLIKGGQWVLPKEMIAEYRTTFSELDVDQELRKARLWLSNNPKKRKTAKGMPRFLSGWLGRAKPEAHGWGKELERKFLDNHTREFSEEEADELFKEIDTCS